MESERFVFLEDMSAKWAVLLGMSELDSWRCRSRTRRFVWHCVRILLCASSLCVCLSVCVSLCFCSLCFCSLCDRLCVSVQVVLCVTLIYVLCSPVCVCALRALLPHRVLCISMCYRITCTHYIEYT